MYAHHTSQDELTSELAEGGFDIDYYEGTGNAHVVGIAV